MRASISGSLFSTAAAIAQLGERQTEDLEVPGSIPGFGMLLSYFFVREQCQCVRM